MLTAQTDHVVSCYDCLGFAAGRRAVHVAGVPQEGMAVDVAGPSGLVEFTEDQPYDVDSRDDKHRIPFQLSEVQCNLQPPLADLVLVISQDYQILPPLGFSVVVITQGCKSLCPLGFLVVGIGCCRVGLGGTVQQSVQLPLCFTAAFSCHCVSQRHSDAAMFRSSFHSDVLPSKKV